MDNRQTDYRKNSLSLWGAVSLGTGVMIGAGILALTGQIAELAGTWFPAAFIVAALIAANSAYSYIKLSNAYPSAGGIATFLEKAYGKGAVTAVASLMMYVSMVINESLVARTFGTYTLQLFERGETGWLVSTLGVGLIAFAFAINLMSNKKIQIMSFVMAVVKTAGLAALAGGGLYAAGMSFSSFVPETSGDGTPSVGNFLASIAIGILAYKGFTTITNSGSEIKDPTKNVGRAIVISLGLCTAVYLLVS